MKFKFRIWYDSVTDVEEIVEARDIAEAWIIIQGMYPFEQQVIDFIDEEI